MNNSTFTTENDNYYVYNLCSIPEKIVYFDWWLLAVVFKIVWNFLWVNIKVLVSLLLVAPNINKMNSRRIWKEEVTFQISSKTRQFHS